MARTDQPTTVTDDPETTTREGSASTGQLVAKLSEDLSRLVRDELQLAQLEVSGKAKQAGIGVGVLGAAGLLAVYGGAALVATTILALGLVLDWWLAALVVAVALLVLAGIAGLVGKERVSGGVPPTPQRTVDNVRRDVDAVRHGSAHE